MNHKLIRQTYLWTLVMLMLPPYRVGFLWQHISRAFDQGRKRADEFVRGIEG